MRNHNTNIIILAVPVRRRRPVKSDFKICYKIVNGLCDLEVTKFFSFAPISYVTRSHNKKLIKPVCHTNGQLNFFSNRVVNYWNSLPLDIVDAETIGSFSDKLRSLDLTRFCRPSRT